MLDEVPDAPADLAPADVAHHLVHFDPSGPRVNVERPRLLDAGARVRRARHAHAHFARGLRHPFRPRLAAVQHIEGDALPLAVVHTAFWSVPDLSAAGL